MERINLPKNSMTRHIILSGLKVEGFTQIKHTNCASTPIYLYYNESIKKVAIFKCGRSNNELLIIGYEFPGKLKIIIDEFKTFNDVSHIEISEILEQIIDGSYFDKKYEITYL